MQWHRGILNKSFQSKEISGQFYQIQKRINGILISLRSWGYFKCNKQGGRLIGTYKYENSNAWLNVAGYKLVKCCQG